MAKSRKLTTAQRESLNSKLPSGLARVLADRKASADSEALLNDIIDVWGGTRQIALDLYTEFKNSKTGGMTRQRIIEMIQRLVVTNTTHDIGKTAKPSDMTDEDLDSVALFYAKRVMTDEPAPAPS